MRRLSMCANAVAATAGLCIASVAPAATVQSNAQLLQDYGGVYSNACRDPGALTLKYLGNSLLIEHDGTTITASNLQSAYSYFGESPPPGFQVALLGEVTGADYLNVLLFHTPEGLFARVEADPKTEAGIGSNLRDQKLHNCDPNKNTPKPFPPAPAPTGPAAMLRDAQFKKLYFDALKNVPSEIWLQTLEAVSLPAKMLNVAGVRYMMLAACKPHDCGDNSLVLFYSAEAQKLYGTIHQSDRKTILGAPPPAIAAELERQWLAEWRGK